MGVLCSDYSEHWDFQKGLSENVGNPKQRSSQVSDVDFMFGQFQKYFLQH